MGYGGFLQKFEEKPFGAEADQEHAMAGVDVYSQWLKVTDPERPVNYYTLLGVQKFEDDAELIRKNYRQRNALVRKYATGVYSQQSQELLNEMARAMLCLTDAQRKADYDATLGRPRQSGQRRSVEQILLGRGRITADMVTRARGFAEATGLEIPDVLISQKMAPIEDVTSAYAESLGLPYMDLNDVPIDESLLLPVNVALARQYTYVPIMKDEGLLLVAAPSPLHPDVEDDLRLRFDMPVRTVLVAPNVIAEMVASYYSPERLAAIRAAVGEAVSDAGKKKSKSKTAAPKPARERSTSEPMTREAKMAKLKMYGIIIWMVLLVLWFLWRLR